MPLADTVPASTQLARGATKPADIEEARRNLARAERAVARELRAAAVRCEDEARRLERAAARPAGRRLRS